MKTPVLLIAFVRPDTTKKVLSQIAKVKPDKLYIAMDGARNKPESKKIVSTIKVIREGVNWPCELIENISMKNLGCRKRVSSAIDWFFKNEESGIVLEDDCVPSVDFFKFMEQMLEKYKDDPAVGVVSGDCYLPRILRPNVSYYFSNYSHIWGWGSWRRFWTNYDVDIKDISQTNSHRLIENKLIDPIQVLFWKRIFKNIFDKKRDTWDHQVTYALWKTNSFCIIPTKNLVTNIGFGKGSTRTTEKDIKLSIAHEKMTFPLAHPDKKHNRMLLDTYVFYNHFFLNNFTPKIVSEYIISILSKR